VLETLKQWILEYGYAAMYGLLCFGIVGVGVPDEILMTVVGYWTSIGWFGFVASAAVCYAGTMTGMTLSYWIGHKVGKPFLWRYGKWVKLTPARLEKAEGFFHRYGLWTVSFGYFIPGVRHLTCYLAGISRVNFWKYWLFAGSGAFIWVLTFLTLGHFIGDSIDTIMPLVHKYMAVGAVAVAILAGAAAYLVMRSRNRKRAVQ